MKRILAAACAALALSVAALPAQAAGVTATRNRNFYVSHASASGSVWMTVNQQTDLTGQQADVTTGCISISDNMNFDSACGPLTMTIDPLGRTGTISGTIAGHLGLITVTLTYTTTRVGTNLPYADVEIIPDAPSVAANGLLVHNGRANGSVTWIPGSFSVDNAGAGILDSITVTAAA